MGGPLTLNGQGNPTAVFIFQIGSTLVSDSASTVVMTTVRRPATSSGRSAALRRWCRFLVQRHHHGVDIDHRDHGRDRNAVRTADGASDSGPGLSLSARCWRCWVGERVAPWLAGEHGWDVDVVQDSETFCRLLIHVPHDLLVNLALDFAPGYSAMANIAGPTFAPAERAGRKLIALFEVLPPGTSWTSYPQSSI